MDPVPDNIKKIDSTKSRIIVGFGPAGMFAALEMLERGIKPIVFERGKRIEERSVDVYRFVSENVLDPESNIQFGEGGAGSYSDGKLFSRAKNSSYVNKVFETYIKFGAPDNIGQISKPHLGTDVLCRIVCNIRQYILENGGEIHFGSKMTDLLQKDGRVFGVEINGEQEYHADAVYLATGHSARDTFLMLHNKGILLEARPISVGMRVEHPAETINLLRYGDKFRDNPKLDAAVYSMTFNNRQLGRGVYSFCMCPGGEVVNASSENGLLVVNGMSYASRMSPYSNAAIVVNCGLSDYESDDPLAAVKFQETIERKAFLAGGGNWNVPAQNLLDYLGGKTSTELINNSCKMLTVPVNMVEIFPTFINKALHAAFKNWRLDYPTFTSDKAILIGAETRASSPVRVLRNDNCESVSVQNLFLIGAGAGYTGGITGSAADGIKAVTLSVS